MNKILAFLFLLAFAGNLFGQTIARCSNQEYANKKLDFYQIQDPITNEKNLLLSLVFDKNGTALTQVDLKTTASLFCDFGVYRGMHLLEPNIETTLLLPPWRGKNFAEQKNPYFEPLTFWLKSEDSKQLSNQITNFTLTLNELTDKYFSEIYFRQSRKMYDSVFSMVNKKFKDIENKAFVNHKKLELKMVEVEAFRLKPKEYSEVFSSIKPEFWLHPSFTRLFETAFSGQLSFEAKDINGGEIGKAVNTSNAGFLLKHVQSAYLLQGDIAQLALLKMLYDGFYSGDFSKEAIKKLVKSDTFMASKNNIVKTAAKNISIKLQYLQPGNEAPYVCLNNLEGEKKCSNQAAKKFKYLVFADTEIMVCKEQLKYLTNIENRFNKHLDIFVVLRKTNLAEAKQFVSSNKIPGTIVMDSQNKFIEKYNVKSFPQCYLLNEKHEIQFVHTKAPLDGFEQQFGSFLQQELFQRLRNQSR